MKIMKIKYFIPFMLMEFIKYFVLLFLIIFDDTFYTGEFIKNKTNPITISYQMMTIELIPIIILLLLSLFYWKMISKKGYLYIIILTLTFLVYRFFDIRDIFFYINNHIIKLFLGFFVILFFFVVIIRLHRLTKDGSVVN